MAMITIRLNEKSEVNGRRVAEPFSPILRS
jgi:hypothetical protein